MTDGHPAAADPTPLRERGRGHHRRHQHARAAHPTPANGRWEPLGGVLELDETIEDGLRREIAEETGAQVDVLPITGVYKNTTRGIVALVYHCHLTTEPADSTDEAAAIAWHNLDDVDQLMTPAYAIRVHDAVSGRPAATRAHDGTNVAAGSHAPSQCPS